MSRTPKSYHQATSYDRYAMEPHAMDWANQPAPYKSYASALAPDNGVLLPEIDRLYDHDLQKVYKAGCLKEANDPLDLDTLSIICMLANGLTARSRQGGGYFYFRSAPSAGALYPTEMYFAALDTPSLPPGIYHCGIHNRFFTRLRKGFYAKHLMAAVPKLPQDCRGIFIISAIFFRSAWKYRKRAYRYVLLDGGHLAESLRLAIRAAGYACRLHYAFDDRLLDSLLGVDDLREGSICCISISGGTGLAPVPDAVIKPLSHSIRAAGRVSAAELTYPEIATIHDASKQIKDNDAKSAIGTADLGLGLTGTYSTVVDSEISTAALNYSETVLKRRSRRNFIHSAIEAGHLNYMLTLLCHACKEPADENPEISSSVCTGFISGNINGVDPGFYVLDPFARTTARVFSGHVIEKMTAVCLDQAWLKNAAVHFVFMSNLEMSGEKWGARGYRYAMLTAGRLGHAVYLGATALKLGCCGIGALYDNEARQVLRCNEASALLYLVAVGNIKNDSF